MKTYVSFFGWATSSASGGTAYTAGYKRGIGTFRNLQAGVGANVTADRIGAALKRFYGDRLWGVNMFLQFRLKPGA